MFDDLYPEAAQTALEAKIARPPEPKQTPRFSLWGTTAAVPKGVAAGAAQAAGSTADVLGAFGSVLGTEGSAGGMFSLPTPEEEKQQREATEKLRANGPDYMSEGGRSFRNVAKDYTPDPLTTHAAERIVFDFSRVASKAVTAAITMGGVPGAIVTGLEEGFTVSDQLAQEGVDPVTRTKVGAVTAVTNAVSFALPVAGGTVAKTTALALTGGPLSFMTQNAATRKILQDADYSKLADQYDPFDPLGLALSTVIPLGFGAMAMRGAAKRTAGQKIRESDATETIATPEAVDAARTSLLRESVDNSNPLPKDLSAAQPHADAHAKAIDQMASGERVNVADVLPENVAVKATEDMAARVEPIRKELANANLMDFMAESKVVTPDGEPLVVYRGEPRAYDGLQKGQEIYFSSDPANASEYAGTVNGANVMPTYLNLKNPVVVDAGGGMWNDFVTKSLAQAKAGGNDGVIIRNVRDNTNPDSGRVTDTYIALSPKQVKSALGNSGLFDPRSGSLTDPLPAKPIAGAKEAAPKVDAVTNQNDVVGNQGGRSADDILPGALAPVDRVKKAARDVYDTFKKRTGADGDAARFEVEDNSTPVPFRAGAAEQELENLGWDIGDRMAAYASNDASHYITARKLVASDAEYGDEYVTAKIRISNHGNTTKAHDHPDVNIAPGEDIVWDIEEKLNQKITDEGYELPVSAPSDARLGYAIATEQAQRGKPSDGNSGLFDPRSGSLTDPLPAKPIAGAKEAAPKQAGAPDYAQNIDLIEAQRIRAVADKMRAKNPGVAAKYDDMALAHELKAERDTRMAEGRGEKASYHEKEATRLALENPDVMVMVEGMDAPKPLSEVMAMIKKDLADDIEDSNLIQVAAECFISTGAGGT